MKFPHIPLLFTLVVIIIIFSGCMSAPSSKETSPVPPTQLVTSATEMTASNQVTLQPLVSPVGTLASLPAGTDIITDPAALNQLMFQNTDFSSVIVASKFENVAAEKIDPNSTILTGFQNGCSFDGTFDKNSGRAYQVAMLIDSKANASKAYDNYDKYIEKLFQSFVKVPLTTVNVSVGDRGKMYVIQNIDQSSLVYYLIFVRGNVFEVVGVEVPVTSTQGDDITIDLAGKADRKITTQPLPIISPAPCPTALQTSSQHYVVAATGFQPDSTHIIVTYQGGPDASSLLRLSIDVNDDAGILRTYVIEGPAPNAPVRVGSSYQTTGSFTGQNRVVATGLFTNGHFEKVLDSVV